MNSWKPGSFTAQEIHDKIESKKFIAPFYQRGRVWTDKQKNEFSDTLKRGLPFGTILLYHDDVNNRYQIIDGLQRASTIWEFISAPAQFFNDGDIDENLPQNLADIAGIANTSMYIVESIKEHLVQWAKNSFKTMSEVQDMQYFDYTVEFIKEYPSAVGKEKDISDAVKPTLKRFRDLCNGLCNMEIPAIIIEGDDDALPEIFERINSKGTQLSKYEIYAATWTRRYPIDEHKFPELRKIVVYNRDRYESMVADGVDLSDFDPAEFVKRNELSLFEVAYGFGKLLGQVYPMLFKTRTDKDNIKEIDSIGFSLITACVGLKNSNSKNLQIKFDELVGENNISLFLSRILQCVDTTTKLVGQYNRFKLNAQTIAGPLHTEFQIISLIANIFVARYATYQRDDKDRPINYSISLESSKDSWNQYKVALEDNAWKRYCLDILQKRWGNAGDTRIDTVIFNADYYGKKIPWSDFETQIRMWYDETKSERREHKRVAQPKEPEKVFLALLYLHIFSAADQADSSKYDIEHLATKKLMKVCLDRYGDDFGLPISSIGNLCLLPEHENRSKGAKTVYEDDAYLKDSKYTLSELEEKFTFTSKNDLRWASDESLTAVEFETAYNKFIDSRFNRMMEKIKEFF